MEVTEDNVFLVTLQGENELHIRTFITGTYLHVLKRHKAKVRNKSICTLFIKKMKKKFEKQSAALISATQQAMPPKFGGKWTEVP